MTCSVCGSECQTCKERAAAEKTRAELASLRCKRARFGDGPGCFVEVDLAVGTRMVGGKRCVLGAGHESEHDFQ